MTTSRFFLLPALVSGLTAALVSAGENPVELANPLVGTAALDQTKFIGNAPPPGEEIYSGFVWPGPALPHGEFHVNPVNKDLELADDNHGIILPYLWQRKTMLGFSAGCPT